MVDTDTTFTYDFAAINDLVVETSVNPKTGKNRVKHILVKDEPLVPTNRFWTSIYARFGISGSFFKYFDHHEVFERISQVRSSDQLRVCVERRTDNGKPVNRLLSVSNPKKPIVPFDGLMEMLDTAGYEDIQYCDGIIESTHKPRVGSADFQILGDKHSNQFMMATPIDGYGLPNVYLSLLREICSNGMIGMAKAFQSSIALGKGSDNVAFALTRVLDQFSNDEGYAALRQRVESAGSSWASVHEAMNLYKILINLHNSSSVEIGDVSESPCIQKALHGNTPTLIDEEEESRSPLIKAFHNMTGDMSRLYGLANLDALSAKRQRTLPVQCKVYDMMNFATEAATHHMSTDGARKLHGWVGTLLSNEYDMEGTCDKFNDFSDFHIDAKFQNQITGSEFISVN